MIDVFKDRYRLGLIMATLFLIGIAASIYQIYKLPHTLMLPDSSHPALFNVYVVLGITFLIGVLTLWSVLNHRNEVIVYRDKQQDIDIYGKESAESAAQTISLDQMRESLKLSKTETEIQQSVLNAVCKQLEAGQGAFYLLQETDGRKKLELKNGFALTISESNIISYELGEGLIGQAAAGGKTLYIDDVPEGYVKIISGLGSASPRYLLIVPVKQKDRTLGVMEVASFTPLSEHQRKFVEDSAQLMADTMISK
jgi:putative methionine-R-sulfoxide reductase with GAF domain